MQETGRAGRDGERADCYLMYTYGDKNKMESMILKSDGDERSKEQQRRQLPLELCSKRPPCAPALAKGCPRLVALASSATLLCARTAPLRQFAPAVRRAKVGQATI